MDKESVVLYIYIYICVCVCVCGMEWTGEEYYAAT